MRICTIMFITITLGAVGSSAIAAETIQDSTGVAAELTAFAQRPTAEREARAAGAETLLKPWLHRVEIKDGEVKRGPYAALAYECYLKASAHTYYAKPGNYLGPALADLERVLELDPTQNLARYTLGAVLVRTGRPREGVVHLAKLQAALRGVVDDKETLDAYMRKRSCYFLVQGYRALGEWDKAMAAIKDGRSLEPSQVYDVMKGLCLAGEGHIAEAITFAVRMPPLKFRHRTALSSGMYSRPSDVANRWIKSQALLADGDVTGARHVLGNLYNDRARRALPFYQQFWQDAGLVYELLHDPEANMLYNMIAWRATMSFAYPSSDHLLSSVVLGFPDPNIPVFITPDDGFEGGSPFGFLAWQLNLMAEGPDSPTALGAKERGLEMCASLLRRHIQADLVRGFRARIYLACDQPELAYPDLVFAQAGFAARGLVDAGTSILLGHQELLAGNNARARQLFDEGIAATPDNANAWRELGVALGRAGDFEGARKAMAKAVALEPDSLEGWFNLGILAYKHRDYDQALVSLEKAWALEPGNQRVQQMLQTVATARRTMLSQ